MKRFSICHFASVHTTTDTRVFHRECVSLAKQHHVTYIAVGGESGTFNGVNVIALPKPPTRLHRLFGTTFNAFWVACKQRADIYHIHDAELIIFGLLLRLWGKQVVYDIHENTYEDILHKPWIPKPLRWLLAKGYRVLEWLSSLTMHTILVIAQPQFSQRFKAKQIGIIQNFADTKQLAPYAHTERAQLTRSLFYMGTIFDYYYNIIPVIKALAILKEKQIEVQLHCVGYTGNYVQQILEPLPEYQAVKNQIQFYGYLKPEAGFEISKKCALGLCLKNQPESILVSHERKFFEYMALGLPSISCNSHIYNDVVTKHSVGLTTDLADASAIAHTIQTAFEGDINQFAQNALKAAESTFNWQSQERILLQTYQNWFGS
ncbi:MAG: glycosyltransferase [Bacteroidia bacterium]|jgi:glycosyltransferase involved in cell wall biosynthesis|nr:glycosyltransferase [Bacteroidia bacterium]